MYDDPFLVSQSPQPTRNSHPRHLALPLQSTASSPPTQETRTSSDSICTSLAQPHLQDSTPQDQHTIIYSTSSLLFPLLASEPETRLALKIHLLGTILRLIPRNGAEQLDRQIGQTAVFSYRFASRWEGLLARVF